MINLHGTHVMSRFLLFCGLICIAGPVFSDQSLESSFLIRNVVIIDGTGAERAAGAVRVSGSIIEGVGALDPLPGEEVIDGHGQVLAPGFIDTHSHVGGDIQEQRGALAAVSQGVTTSVLGQDGGSSFPLKDFFQGIEDNPVALNLASYSGFGTIREQVMGEDFRRFANDGEIEAMSALLETEMNSGALGLSSGLEYEPGIYSRPAEVIALARVAAKHNGRYISHVRSEDRWFLEAVDEIIEIGRATGMPVQISHFKLAMKSLWGRADEVIAKLDAARAEGIDITADIYPYEYWQSNIMVLVPSRDLNARSEFEYALREIASPEGMWFSKFEPNPEYVGMKLTEIAQLRSLDPVTTLMQMAAESLALRNTDSDITGADGIIAYGMTEKDIHALLSWPHTNICTDGGLIDLHPRARGTYPRILGRYVREQGVLGLEEAVFKMTGLAAAHMGFTDRGTITPGAAADLVLFDPDTVIDHAAPLNSQALSTGISTVWVNGVAVYYDGAATGEYPGKVLRRNDQSP